MHFYPRSPCGERHEYCSVAWLDYSISIHALLAESDSSTPAVRSQFIHFYPRSPCGERPAEIGGSNQTITNFYPRSPCGERPFIFSCYYNTRIISIHALLAESDTFLDPYGATLTPFLSTLSLRRATVHYDNYNLHCVISIHALLAESDAIVLILAATQRIFLSTLSLRRATLPPWHCI